MCQARPGVRCTSHAKAHLSNARKDVTKALQEWDAVKNTRASDKKTEKLDNLEAAQDRLYQAEQDYYSSAGGLKELKNSLTEHSEDSPEYAQIQAQMELAQYDKTTQNLAYQLHQGYKANVSSAMRTQHEILKAREHAQADSLARALNEKSASVPDEKIKMRIAKAQRMSHEEAMRMQASGIDAQGVEYSRLRDVVKKRHDHDIYLPLNGGDFGRARDYFPFGAYGKITEMRYDEASSALQVNIEGKLWKTVNGFGPVLHKPRQL